MAQSIMDAIENNLNQRTVSNALYELMLDWRASVERWHEYSGDSNKSKTERKNANKKRKWIEIMIGRFLNKDYLEVRALLEKHYGVKVGQR